MSNAMVPANDVTTVHPTRGAGRDVWKAIATIRRGVSAGTPAGMRSARAAAAYAWPRLGVAVPIPSTDDAGVWALVVRVVEAMAQRLDAHAIAFRVSYR